MGCVRSSDILVSVLMPAYNHGKYIAQAIESFLSQEGIGAQNAELIIGNDASTDNTLSIAQSYSEKYPHRIKLYSYSQNRGLIGNYRFLVEQAQGKYLAILESDDFYTDNLKLDKQVKYLEANPNCSLVFTSGRYVNEAGEEIGVKLEDERVLPDNNGALYKSVLFSNPVLAVTACFRKSVFDTNCNLREFEENKFVTFDYPVWIALAHNCDFYAMADVTCSYRVSSASISNNSNYNKREEFYNGIDRIVEYSVNKLGYLDGENVQDLRNERLVKHMLLALAFSNFERYSYFCKKIKLSGKVKWVLIKYFPWLFKFKKRKLIGTGAVSSLAVKG